MTAAKDYCRTNPAIAYASRNSGLEIHGIEYGVTDYVYAVSGAWAGKAAHAPTVSALTTPPEGGHISESGEAVYTLMNASECNRRAWPRRAAQEAARRAMEEIEALNA